MNGTRKLDHVLTELIRKNDLEPKMLEQKVLALWGKYLGAPFDTKTVPVSLSNGILKIYTEYPAYSTALSFHKPKIIAEINAELGRSVLRDLRIEVRPIRSAASHKDETEAPSSSTKAVDEESAMDNTDPVPPEQLEGIEQALTDVSDPHLKESLRRLFATQSKNKP